MFKQIIFLTSLALASTVLIMCDEDDGPAEQLGQDIDEAVDDVQGN